MPMKKAIECLFLITMSTSCALPREQQLVVIPQAGLRPVTHIDRIFDYRTAVASIASILERDLGLAPFPVTFRFYPNRPAFEAALVAGGYDPNFARATASTMMAVGGHRGVLLNEGALGVRSWPERTALLAHELAHSLQYELGGGRRGTSDQWLREGFAEWLSIRVIERLDGISLGTFRLQRQNEVRAVGRAHTPALSAMITFRQWVEVSGRRGAAAYAHAFLAVDFLIEHHGIAAILDYFARFASSEDRAANFRAAFGQDLDAFESALTTRLCPK
jgi:hypothetical protein